MDDALHELGNRVGTILQLAHLARRGVADDDQVAVDLDLLLAEAERAAETLGEAAARAPRRTVLVVEDDPVMRSLVERTLGEHGLNVIGASSVGEAVAAAVRAPVIDLVLTDLGIPGLAGDGLAPALATAGGAAVVVMSGAVVEPPPGTTLLAKPFRPDDLVEAALAALTEDDGSDG